MIYRLIAADWAKAQGVKPDVVEGEFSYQEIVEYNKKGFNCYFLPNHPSKYTKGRSVNGRDIDVFNYVFVDMDLKDNVYPNKESFINTIKEFSVPPTSIVDSGNGVHVYWQIKDLDAMSYLRLQRRLIRKFKTDHSLATLYQLMRMPDTINVKNLDKMKVCEVIESNPEKIYTCEQLDKALPKISVEDEAYCKMHYEVTYNPETAFTNISEELPTKFKLLMVKNDEIKNLFSGPVKDRSAADFRLGHLLFANGFTKEEATSVLVNTAKAIERNKVHRNSYAINIVNKVWSEATSSTPIPLETSVNEILRKSRETPKNTRFKCNDWIDATQSGFRLSEVLGIVGKEGNGKTTWALNIFKWFIERNPEYVHVFVSLEQPDYEIAERWHNMCKGNESMNDKVHILGNYNTDGTHRDLSLKDIEKYIVNLEKSTNQKVGCVVIDYLAILSSDTKGDEFAALKENCKRMKPFAITTNTFLVMLSQSARGKGGIGDVELDIDSAYGTNKFEAYVDYMMSTWQPLKRVYDLVPHMKVTAFKMCKIRKLNIDKDKIKKDCIYTLMYSTETEEYRKMSSMEIDDYNKWIEKATDIRNSDKSKNPSGIRIIDWDSNNAR